MLVRLKTKGDHLLSFITANDMENIVPLNYTELESIIVGDSNDGIIIENERVHNISIKEQRAKMQLEMIDSYKSALERITQKAHTEECKLKIELAYNQYIKAMHDETTYPFERKAFHSECPSPTKPLLHPYKHQGEQFTPRTPPMQPVWRTNHTLDPDTVAILYVVLLDSHPHFATRMIEALQEPQHTFVIHVDAGWDDTYNHMVTYAATRKNVFILQERLEVQWGGFSIVNATLLGMKYGFALGRYFHFVTDLSGTAYPLKSNQEIRKYLAKNANSVYMNIHPEPNHPSPELWHYYVECDGAVHRIARLTHARGISMHMGGQWFVIPTHVAEWFLKDTLPVSYLEYAEHVVIADEHYFATMIKNSPYCVNHVMKDLTFLVFSSFEKGTSGKIPAYKCLQPDPDRCGRSPTTLTMEMQSSIEMTDALFARKFDITNPSSMDLLDVIDANRFNEDKYQKDILNNAIPDDIFMIPVILPHSNRTFDTDTSTNEYTSDDTYYCMRMASTWGDRVVTVPCDSNDKFQKFVKGRCVNVDTTKHPSSVYSRCSDCKGVDEGPRFPSKTIRRVLSGPKDETYCQIQSIVRGAEINAKPHETKLPDDRICLDISGQNTRIGGTVIGYQCIGMWNQYFRMTHDCRISATQPDVLGQVRKNIDNNISLSNLCLQTSKQSEEHTHGDVKTSNCTCITNDSDIESASMYHSSQQFRYLYFSKQLPTGMGFVNGKYQRID